MFITITNDPYRARKMAARSTADLQDLPFPQGNYHMFALNAQKAILDSNRTISLRYARLCLIALTFRV